MITLQLTSYCKKTVEEFVKAMLQNPRQNCVGCNSTSSGADWKAYDKGLIMEFINVENPEAGVGTLREFSDCDKENLFKITVEGITFDVVRDVEDTFKINWNSFKNTQKEK